MTGDPIERAAQILLHARRGNYLLDGLPEDCRPRTIEEAIAVAERLVELWGEPTVGYLLGLTNPYMQKIFKVSEPYYARILRSNLRQSPARIPAKELLSIGLECEVAFRMGRGLPARRDPYAIDEVADAVAAMLPSIEVVNSHFRDWLKLDMPTVLADNGTDGPLVCGAERSDWRGIDRPGLVVQLRINGRKVEDGKGGNALGDPLAALAWLANALAKRGGGLKVGDVVNTGTTTALHMAKPGDDAVATFGALGEVRVAFPA